MELRERNKNIETVGTNLFFGIRVLSVLALYVAFDTHLESALKWFCVGVIPARIRSSAEAPDRDNEISTKGPDASDGFGQTDLNL